MKVTNKYSIYLDRRQSEIFIDVMQGDTYTRELELSLYSGGKAWVIPPTASVAVAYSGPSGKGIYDTLPDGAAACAVDQNTVTAVLVPQIMSMAGRTRISLIFIDENGCQLATFSVTVRVAASPVEGAGETGDYINILNWTQAAMATLATDLSTKLDQYAADLSQNFCYVAEDDGNGNVTIKPFHLGGVTDKTLQNPDVPADAAKVGEALAGKAPAGFGLGGTFSKVYSWDEADSLVVPGWYLVDAGEGQRGINGEQMMGVQLVRVDGEPLTGTVCLQTWVEDATRAELRREYNSNTKKWGDFYSINPRNIPGRICATNEFHGGFRVYSVLIDVGTVNAGSTVGIELGIEAHKAFLDIIPYARYRQPLSDMSGAEQSFTYYGGNKIHVMVSTSAMLDDADNDGEVDTITGYKHYLNIENSSGVALEVRCLLKYTDDFAWE